MPEEDTKRRVSLIQREVCARGADVRKFSGVRGERLKVPVVWVVLMKPCEQLMRAEQTHRSPLVICGGLIAEYSPLTREITSGAQGRTIEICHVMSPL